MIVFPALLTVFAVFMALLTAAILLDLLIGMIFHRKSDYNDMQYPHQ